MERDGALGIALSALKSNVGATCASGAGFLDVEYHFVFDAIGMGTELLDFVTDSGGLIAGIDAGNPLARAGAFKRTSY